MPVTSLEKTALYRFFKNHDDFCNLHVYSSDDRHCSCGRDEALAEVQRLQMEVGEDILIFVEEPDD